ncbi:sigma 54-interacting transcriptional regulator [Clostridium sp. CX1]|uniref:Sigma 54-interacting transcriptional regulator n=1 Tax=Clostridium tanneri TaxID=3037988 RepID=A0ABU4JX25_9CLOT|nr:MULTISPECIES: sigma 54-interacting transcriptional regulator [unclassified Clostridium]MCT8975145.1 sigma 54-interacting transcriptional regulator [Clostridium sp. CX1]MDW8802708.1 sigma 54-interacting transcriptional regulator [Clostridium sp. A1-XYC3]
MEKKLAIISYSPSVMDTYQKQIVSLFSDKVLVDKYFIGSEEIRKGIEADLVLLPSYSIFLDIKPYINKSSEVIVINRTISQEALDTIMNIPEGTEGILLDESLELAVQMVSIIYGLGGRHIELTPASVENHENTKEKTVISLGELTSTLAPGTDIINLGNALLDLDTIVDIGAKLNLIHVLQRQDIRKSYKESVTRNSGLSNIIRQTNRFESELDILLQVLDDGIIGVNSKGIISIFNEGAENIIGYKRTKIVGGQAAYILPHLPFEYVLKNREPIKEKLININGYDVVVSTHPIIHSNRLYGAVAIVRKFSDIEKKQHKLREQLIGKGHRAKYSFEDISGESEEIKKCIDIAKRMAKSDSSILLTGESGTGKELFAQAIHNGSKRKNYQFVAVNCGALPESLLESELFGYEEGAFTGARKGGKPGLFELAHNGTLFLDEIGEMPLNLQMRLLRVLQEREVMRIGGDRLIKVNIRIIVATNRDLKTMVKKGEFREDLYYRLKVLPLKLPSLRTRKEDILPLINEMEKTFNTNFDLTKAAKEALLAHSWKGNIRELKNYVEYFANLGLREVDVEDLPFDEEEEFYEDTLNSEEESLVKKLLEIGEDKIQRYLFVLEELEKSYTDKRRLGRRTLYLIALEKGFFLSEQEIRTILINLEKLLMVKIYTGRSGTVITDLGRKVIKELKQKY